MKIMGDSVKPNILINFDTLVKKCSYLLIQESNLLNDLITFTEGNNDPIPLPSFITEQLINDIISILENNDLQPLEATDIEYSIQMLRVSDFLDINKVTKSILPSIIDRLDHRNCFKIFSITNKSPYFQEITNSCILLMMSQLNQYYCNIVTAENHQDPFVDEYVDMKIYEIMLMIFYPNQPSTLTKIMIMKNWWNKNKHIKFRHEVLNILQFINETAAYIPRQIIKFMRRIRDSIMDDIKKMESKISS